MSGSDHRPRETANRTTVAAATARPKRSARRRLNGGGSRPAPLRPAPRADALARLPDLRDAPHVAHVLERVGVEDEEVGALGGLERAAVGEADRIRRSLRPRL